MMKFLALVAMLGYGGYKLHKKSERWLELFSPLLGSPRTQDHGSVPSDEGPARTAREATPQHSRRFVLLPVYALALVGLLAVGRWLTPAVVSDGYDAGADVAAATVARASAELAYSTLDHPVQRLLIPARRVVDVRREPGNCSEPLGPPEHREYVADVRLYTLFALLYRTVTVTCGGAVW